MLSSKLLSLYVITVYIYGMSGCHEQVIRHRGEGPQGIWIPRFASGIGE